MSNTSTIHQARMIGRTLNLGDGFQEFISEIALEMGRRSGGDNLIITITDALADTVTDAQTAAANMFGMWIVSGATSTLDAFVQVFNTAAASVTLGTTAPFEVFHVESTKSRGLRIHPGTEGSYSTAVSFAATTTHDGSTAPAAADRPTVYVFTST